MCFIASSKSTKSMTALLSLYCSSAFSSTASILSTPWTCARLALTASAHAFASAPARTRGVGCFRKPPLWLQHGDEVVCEIDGIGRIANRVTASPPRAAL